MKISSIWEAVAFAVAFIFSIVVWFRFLGLTFTAGLVIDTALLWIVGVAILVIVSILNGFLAAALKTTLHMSDELSLWEVIGSTIGVLFTIILWFTFLKTPVFTIVSTTDAAGIITPGILDISILWAIGVIIMNIGALVIGYLSENFKTELEKTITKIATSVKKP